MSNKIKIMVCLVLVVGFVSSLINAQTRIYDEAGNFTGLLNANPDPYGDPWVINEGGLKPLSAEEQAAWDALPYFTVPQQLRGRSLPKTVDHSTATFFRPIFNQIGGSCGQASGTGYHFTFERNQLLNTMPTDKNNICAYGFTWNFVNGGNGTGSWPYQGYEIEKTMGAGHVADFNNADNGGSGTAWMDGYEGYYKANDVHVTEVVKFSNTIDITAMKNWFVDKGTGTGKGGSPITFCASVSYKYGTVASGPFAGQKLVTDLPDGSAHAMTWAGYSDEVSYDVNNDGKISNDIDITRDGKVDISDYEQGAVQLVNSWGPTGFGNGGKCWQLYSGMHANNIASIKVAKHNTLLMVKAKVTSTARNGITMKTGYATDVNATAPTATKSYGGFNKQGGTYPMCGSGANATITVGLDATEHAGKLIGGKGKIFLQITGTGTVVSMSAIDYSSGAPKEFVSTQANVAISGTTNVGVAVEIGPTQIKENSFASAKAKSVSIRKIGNAYTMTLPTLGSYLVTIKDLLGKTVDQFSTSGKSVVTFGANLPSGAHIVSIVSPGGLIIEKLNIVR